MRNLPIFALVLCAACSGERSDIDTSGDASRPTDAEYEARAVSGIHDLLLGDIEALATAAGDLCAAVPSPSDGGWNAADDADAVDAMRAAWARARTAYELSEGAIAPLFPEIDRSIDARYDDFLSELAPAGDPNLFDGNGVTGMHAIERILWADSTPPRVVQFESSLPGYVPAAFPADQTEAGDFTNGLCAQLVTDVADLEKEWKPLHLHVAIAFQGLVSLMNEQSEKVRKASSNEEESRYSQRTLADLRDNLEGTRSAVAVFEPWLASKSGGASLVDALHRDFDVLGAAYSEIPGDAIPGPPDSWSAESPSANDLTTPFGRLYATVNAAVDPNDADSVVSHMEAAGSLLGLALPPL